MSDFFWPFPPDPPEIKPKEHPDDPDIVWVEDDWMPRLSRGSHARSAEPQVPAIGGNKPEAE